MVEITDTVMRERIAAARSYVLVLLYEGPDFDPERSRPVIWEHGRRNMALNDEGIMPIVCPITDHSPLCGWPFSPPSPTALSSSWTAILACRRGYSPTKSTPAAVFPGRRCLRN